MAKSRDAFRTISEVAEALDTPAHVLRFWESKFSQIKPVKRAGGRRYYRPDDLALLAGIKTLLHEQGLTIKGAQKLLREQGIKHVIGLGAPMVADAVEIEVAAPMETKSAVPIPVAAPEVPPAPEQTAPAQSAQAEEAQPAPGLTMPADAATNATDIVPPSASTDTAPPAATKMPPQPAAPAGEVRPPVLAPDAPKPAPGARFFDALQRADPARIRANASQIAPLLDQLKALRDRMRTAH